MKLNELIPMWLLEEEKTFTGWDFSYLTNRTATQELPWDYKTTVLSEMKSTTTLLDMGTGGGEFLLSLSPPKGKTYAITWRHFRDPAGWRTKQQGIINVSARPTSELNGFQF
jgi:hypothetical protein